jgi:hypothetical protein
VSWKFLTTKSDRVAACEVLYWGDGFTDTKEGMLAGTFLAGTA